MLSKLIEENFPENIISPFTVISFLLCALIFAIFIRCFDVAIFIRPLWYDFTKFRVPNLLRRITFQKLLVISRPELVVGGLGDDWKTAQHVCIHKAVVSSHDLDLMFHMNNSRYLREADIARFKFLHDTGLFHACWFRGVSLVTASQTIRYRREIRSGVRYEIVTRCVGYDAKALFIEHVFVVKGEVHAILEVREGIAVPKKIKEKFPQTENAPLTWVMRDILKWNKTQVPLDLCPPPADFSGWLEFLHSNYSRVIGVSSPKN